MENAVIEPYRMGGQIWNQLQELKEEITQELVDEGPLCQSQPDAGWDEKALAAENREIELLHRSQLQARLRKITEAQDRLLDSTYGKCVDCGKQISVGRLAVDPAASLCLRCQGIAELQS